MTRITRIKPVIDPITIPTIAPVLSESSDPGSAIAKILGPDLEPVRGTTGPCFK